MLSRATLHLSSSRCFLYLEVANFGPELVSFVRKRCDCIAEAAGARTSHGEAARVLRHARSPQRVRRAQDTFARRHSESTISAEGSPSSRHIRLAPQQERFNTDYLSSRHIRTAPQQKPASSGFICTAPQRQRFDTHDLRKGFAELGTHSLGATARALQHRLSQLKTHSHGVTAIALRHARSLQRVHFGCNACT